MAHVPMDKLEASINKILNEYADNLQENVGKLAKEFAKQGAKTVSAEARAKFGGTGKYASGWTSRYETGRYSAQGIIYNKDVPGLPHLLENPHALRNGGRTSGRTHIAPVEEKVVQEFERAVRQAI